MVELKKKRKRKTKQPRAGQVISQKVVVNVGNKGYSTRREQAPKQSVASNRKSYTKTHQYPFNQIILLK
jgi:hypothetical protein